MSLFHREKKIVEAAIAAGDLTTLVTAIQTAGLKDALDGPGPLTVFAPTDAAFEKIATATMDDLLRDKARLNEVLKYHVVPGKMTINETVTKKIARTLQGTDLRFDTSEGFKVDGARVVKADIECKNGIIHTIDTVLMPERGGATVAGPAFVAGRVNATTGGGTPGATAMASVGTATGAALTGVAGTDKWTTMIQKMKADPEMGKKVTAENRALCTCPSCPTYNDCAKQKDERMYCDVMSSKSVCIKDMKGCICPTCPVTSKMGLKHAYYCIKGNEKVQRGL